MRKLLVIAALCPGCAIAPAEPAPVPATGGRSPSTAEETAAGTVSLDEALALAEQTHPELEMALARIRAAEGRADQAGRWPNPELVVRAEKVTGDEEYLAGVAQRFPIGGRLGAAARVEERDRERISREAEAVRLEVRARVHAAFAAALYAEEARRLQAESLQDAQAGVALAKARLAAGDALPEETARAEMEEVRARVELERASGLRDRAVVALAAAIGSPRMRIDAVEGKLEATFELPTLESLIARIGESPFVGAGESAIATERARVDLAEAERIPDISIELLYRRETGQSAFDVGFGVTLPLFDRNQGRIREAQADAAFAEARARATRNDVERQLRDGHARLTRALAQVRLLRDEILPRAETVLGGSEKRYAAGDISFSDVLPMRRDRVQLKLAHLESLREVVEAWSDLKRVLPEKR